MNVSGQDGLVVEKTAEAYAQFGKGLVISKRMSFDDVAAHMAEQSMDECTPEFLSDLQKSCLKKPNEP